MGDVNNAPWMKDRKCRGWMERIYDRRAAIVSPVLLDIDAAYRSGRIFDVMKFVALCNPKFHVSFIDACVSLNDLADHLRQLIYFVDEEGKELTLRFADGAVMLALQNVLSASQWKALLGPIMQWRIHDRKNNLKTLAGPCSEEEVSFPLRLTNMQISQLREEMAVYQTLANLQKIYPSITSSPPYAKQYEWADSARVIWFESGATDRTIFWLFMKGVFDTDGKLLRVPGISEIFSGSDLAKVKQSLGAAIAMNRSSLANLNIR